MVRNLRFLFSAWLLLCVATALAQPIVEGPTAEGSMMVRFRFQPGGDVSRVDVLGDFTGWVQSPLVMEDPDGDGVYEAAVALEPGPHQYKFVVDTRDWFPDPANPELSEEGEFANSLVRVPTAEEFAGQPAGATAAAPPRPPSPPWSGPRWPFAALGAGLAAVAMAGRRRSLLGSGAPCVSRLSFAFAAMLLAVAVRLPLAFTTPEEIDEYDYLPIAQRYAGAMARSEVRPLIDEPTIREHPRFGFLIQGATAWLGGAGRDYSRVRLAARMASILLAGLTAALLAWRWPVAALFWAFSGISVRYTSVAYLDAAVALFAVLCVLAFGAAWRRGGTMPCWPRGRGAAALLGVSAFGAGATVASKYLGAVGPLSVAAGFVVIAISGRARGLPRLTGIFAAYVLAAVLAMMVCDPSLWHGAPWRTVVERLLFHRGFAQGDVVTSADFPWFQPLVWLWSYTSFSGDQAIGWALLDRVVVVLAAPGLALAVKQREPMAAIAAVVTLAFLFVWPTKWPQYETVLLPWLCIGAEAALVAISGLIQSRPSASAMAARSSAAG